MFNNAMLSGFELYPRWVPLFFRFSEIVLSSFPLRRLRSFEMARKGINTAAPLKKLRSAEVRFFLSRDSRADIL